MLYQIDVRARSELFGRLKREGMEKRNKAFEDLEDLLGDTELAKARFKYAFDPSRPWDYVFAELLNEKKRSTCWFQQLDLPILRNQQTDLGQAVDGDVKLDTFQSTRSQGRPRVVPPPDVTGYTAHQQ